MKFRTTILFSVLAAASCGGDDMPSERNDAAGAPVQTPATSEVQTTQSVPPAVTNGQSTPSVTATPSSRSPVASPTNSPVVPIGGMAAPAATSTETGEGQEAPTTADAGAEMPSASSWLADPKIPEVTAMCPDWKSGTINFMGLGGIRVEVGPKAAGPTAPMVFYWHGTGSTSGEFAGMAAPVQAGVAAEGGILVSFLGTTGGDALSGTSTFGRGDIKLVDQLTACAVRDHNVDPRRIYTTGCSAGGLFATALAVLRSSYIAAAAPNSGGLVFPQSFEGEYTPALMTMHGAPGRDVVVIDFSNSSKTAGNLFKDHGGFVVNCNHGGRHCGARALAGDVWEFFKAHPYGVSPQPSPWESGLPSGFSEVCEIKSGG